MLKIEGLFKQFGGFVAIDDVSFELLEGEKHAIIGPNGAGKTTFFNLVTGHLLPDRGSVAFQGEDITGRPPHRIVKLGLARSFQRINIYPRMSVFENVQVALIARERQEFRFFRLAAGLCGRGGSLYAFGEAWQAPVRAAVPGNGAPPARPRFGRFARCPST